VNLNDTFLQVGGHLMHFTLRKTKKIRAPLVNPRPDPKLLYFNPNEVLSFLSF